MKLKINIAIILLFCAIYATAQTNATIEKMQKERQEIQQKVNETSRLIASTDNSITSQVANLNLVSARLAEIRKLLDRTNAELRSLDAQSRSLEREMTRMQNELEECRTYYARACRFYQHQHGSLNPLTFLFSADSFRQMMRRSRYLTEYSGSLSKLGREIEEKQAEIAQKQEEVRAVRAAKQKLQAEQKQQTVDAAREETRQNTLIAGLKKKSSSLKKEMATQQQRMTKLGQEIDRQIQLAIKEEQERKKRAEGARKKTTTGQPKMQEPDEDVKLSGTFESNKGRLPMPITGPYLVVSTFGVQTVAGLKDVKMNNLGIDLQGERGAQAKVIFDGTVTTIFQQGQGQKGVLVRHGKYISVYCNIGSVRVSKGDTLKTGDVIGTIQETSGRTILHFQLHNGTTKLNPLLWLR